MRDGEVVVDHVVGTVDGSRPWRPDTLVLTWSVAEPFAHSPSWRRWAARALGLDQRVAGLWPAYGVRGKEATSPWTTDPA